MIRLDVFGRPYQLITQYLHPKVISYQLVFHWIWSSCYTVMVYYIHLFVTEVSSATLYTPQRWGISLLHLCFFYSSYRSVFVNSKCLKNVDENKRKSVQIIRPSFGFALSSLVKHTYHFHIKLLKGWHGSSYSPAIVPHHIMMKYKCLNLGIQITEGIPHLSSFLNIPRAVLALYFCSNLDLYLNVHLPKSYLH